jgi:hypothetical protein
MAIISEIQEPVDDSLERVDLVDYNSSDFDEFLSDAEVAPTNEDNAAYTPTPEVTVTINMESDEAKKMRNQKRNMRRRIATERRQQQMGDAFDYSRRKERQEAEAYSPTSNYRIPDDYDQTPRKHHHVNSITSPSHIQAQNYSIPKQDSAYRKLHGQCPLNPKAKHSTFQCKTLRKALGAPPPPDNEGPSEFRR